MSDRLFVIVFDLLLLAVLAWLVGGAIASEREDRRIRRARFAAYLERVGILLAVDGPSLTPDDLNQLRLDRYTAKRAGQAHWRVAA